MSGLASAVASVGLPASAGSQLAVAFAPAFPAGGGACESNGAIEMDPGVRGDDARAWEGCA